MRDINVATVSIVGASAFLLSLLQQIQMKCWALHQFHNDHKTSWKLDIWLNR